MPDAQTWGIRQQQAYCEACDWHYLLPAEQALPNCPHCAQTRLLAEEPGDGQFDSPPELVVPFAVSDEALSRQINQFAGGIWFAPGDLDAETLKTRLQPLFLPLWLVDSQVEALWQAEVGFDYEAVSHHDRFDQKQGGWTSQEITETRINWEARVGRLKREYHNIFAPALEEHARLLQTLGNFNLQKGQPYRPQAVGRALIRLPNRTTTDAWPDTAPAFRSLAAGECQQACQAQHLRDFRWSPTYSGQNWTLLLLPVYATYYQNDDQQPQPVLIHGQTGKLAGPRRASMKRAKRTAIIIVAVAAVIFFISLLLGLASLAIPLLLLVAGLGVALAVVVGMLAVAPLVIAWQFNRSQRAGS